MDVQGWFGPLLNAQPPGEGLVRSTPRTRWVSVPLAVSLIVPGAILRQKGVGQWVGVWWVVFAHGVPLFFTSSPHPCTSHLPI